MSFDPKTNPTFLERSQLEFEGGVAFSLQLKVQTQTSTTLSIRGATKAGIFNYEYITVGSSTPETKTFRIPDIPVFVSVLDKGSYNRQGGVLCTLSLMANSDVIYELCSGPVYCGRSISWPYNVSNERIPGRGMFDLYDSADPAAGAEIHYVIPNSTILRVHGLKFTLVIDATVANRRVHVQFSPVGTQCFECISSVDQPASSTFIYHVAPYGYLPAVNDNNHVLIPMPPEIWLYGLGEINTSTTLLKAGDNFSVSRIAGEWYFDAQT